MDINARIKVARTEAGLSMNQLAKRLGVTSTCVWNWDHDNTSPRPDTLPRLAEALGVTVQWLRTGETSDRGRPADGDRPEILDTIFSDTRRRIASLLRTEPDRVIVTMKLDDGLAESAVQSRVREARAMVRALASTPQGSDALIAERRAAALSE